MPVQNRSRQRRIALALVTGANGAPYSTIAPRHDHSAYVNYQCRCDICRAANATYARVRLRGLTKTSRPERPRAHAERLLTQNGKTGEQEQVNPQEQPVPAPPQLEPVAAPTIPPIQRKQWPVPPITDTAARWITTTEFYDEVCRAYYNPEITMPLSGGTRRVAGTTQVILDGRDTITWVGEVERSDGPSDLLQDRKRSMPKARGGRGGSRGPSDWKELFRRLQSGGYEVTRSPNHVRVTSRDGKFCTLPSTASDHRALANAVAQLRKDGFEID